MSYRPEEGGVIMTYRRKASRMVIERRGELRRGGKAVACTVVDLSEAGVRVRAGSPFAVGEELQLTCRLAKDHVLECTVQVAHATSSSFGARIIDISPEQLTQLNHFISELIALNFPSV
jgi:hypothetical protein